MRYINNVFEIKASATITCIDTQEILKAHSYQVVRQLEECSDSPLLSYDEDPLYCEVCAIQVNVDGEADIIFDDTNYEVEGFYFIWGYNPEKLYYVEYKDVVQKSIHEYKIQAS